MTVQVLYQSSLYTEEMPLTRYVVKAAEGGYRWCEQNKTDGYDYRQGRCDAEDLPEPIRQKCDDYGPNMFYCCEWPFDS